MRKLLEQGTGVATGSVYNDSSLRKIFIGEGFCDDTTLCIKAHPSTHPFELISDDGNGFMLSSPMLMFRNSVTKSPSDALHRHVMFRSHCRPKSDSHGSHKSIAFTRAIIVDRNPLEAAFSELQRLIVNRQGTREGSHISRLPRNFKRHVSKRMWNRLCADYLRLGIDYVLAWHSYVQFVQKFGMNAVYLARYEDLKDKQRRGNVLLSMLRFLNAEMLPGSLECVFARAEDSRIRRGSRKGSSSYYRSKDSDFKGSSYMTLSDFLNSEFMNKPLVQWMWNIVGKVAEVRGYEAPKGFMLSNYQSRNETANVDIARAVGFPPNRWYYEEGKMAVLRTIGINHQTNESEEDGGQERVISLEYTTCLTEASLAKRAGQVIVTFAGNLAGVAINDKKSVFPILLNSILWMRMAGVRELLVVCFDKEYEYILRALGVNTCYLELSSRRDEKSSTHGQKTSRIAEIYNQRLGVIEALLRAEIDVVHTDIDAVWTENPLAVLSSYHNSDRRRSDIVASRGTFPQKELVSWGGSTLCMGLISFRATPGVREILRIARQASYNYHGDDQIGLNRGLAQLGLVWFAEDQEMGRVILPSISNVSEIRVALLPVNIVRRDCTSNESPRSMIMHCFDKHDTSFDADTNRFMKRRGLWLLKENWIETLTSQECANHTIETLRASGLGMLRVR